MTKLKDLLMGEEKNEYIIDDFDNPNGWHWKQVDHLIDMGFKMTGNTRLTLDDKKHYDDVLNVEIYKQNPSGDYVMILNGRKYVFKSFVNMINKIDDFGKVE